MSFLPQYPELSVVGTNRYRLFRTSSIPEFGYRDVSTDHWNDNMHYTYGTLSASPVHLRRNNLLETKSSDPCFCYLLPDE